MNSKKIIEEVKSFGNKDFAEHHQKFFQTQKGGYGEGDKFFGLKTPQIRTLAKKYKNLEIDTLQILLQNDFHEVRLLALFIMVYQYNKISEKRENIYELYRKNTKHINNWDLIDLTAYHIIGHHEYILNRTTLIWKLAKSKTLWNERISILSAFYNIKQNDFSLTLELCNFFIEHKHHLIHKATGWMLREIGKRDEKVLTDFLNKNSKIMPRTMLRYSIERLTKEQKNLYMKK
ncbi:MAG: DNA alkylation repair protein [Candidatus Gastranaerophilales bacterium]|nr:DNA alkylation repair protein [Candidatus Gastranaerophilales bacterium]